MTKAEIIEAIDSGTCPADIAGLLADFVMADEAGMKRGYAYMRHEWERPYHSAILIAVIGTALLAFEKAVSITIVDAQRRIVARLENYEVSSVEG